MNPAFASLSLAHLRTLDHLLQLKNLSHAAERLGVSPSAVYRIVQTLADMGYLRKIGRNAFELGPQVISDGFAYLASRDLVEVAMAHLNDLRDRTSLSCHLSIREQTDSLYLYRALAPQRLAVNIPVGTRLPCHSTALGRVLLNRTRPLSLTDPGRTYYEHACRLLQELEQAEASVLDAERTPAALPRGASTPAAPRCWRASRATRAINWACIRASNSGHKSRQSRYWRNHSARPQNAVVNQTYRPDLLPRNPHHVRLCATPRPALC